MIVQRLFWLILAAFPTVSNQQAATEPELDWATCGEVKRCFCINPQDKLAEIPGAPVADECNTAVAHKFFSDDSAVFHLLTKGTGAASPGDNSQLMLYKGNDPLFGCELKQGIDKIDLKTSSDFTREVKIGLFEDQSRFNAGFYLCSVKVDRISELIKLIKLKPGNLQMKLISSNPKDYAFYMPGIDLFTKKELQCNPYEFKDKSSSSDYHILPIVNRHKDILNCGNYKSSYKMKYDLSGQTFDMMQLECIVNPVDRSYQYAINDGVPDANGATELKPLTADLDLYTFYCAAPIEEVCPDPGCTEPDCPHFVPGGPGNSAALKCPDKKWYVDDQYFVLAADASCKKDLVSRNPNDLAFVIDLPSESDKKAEGARCFTDYLCTKKSPLQTSGKVEVSDEIVKCPNTGVNLTILDLKTNETRTATSLTCDKNTGMWRNVTGEEIAFPSRVTCIENKVYQQVAKAKFEQAHVYLIIVGSALGTLLFLALGIFIFYKVKKANESILKGKKGFLKLKRDEKIAFVQEIYEKAMKLTPGTMANLLGGVRVLHLLLETETQDPKIWEHVYPFLMRFHGTIVSTDRRIWHMFSRYLYLQAKKIIDKHGWTCKKPIRLKKQKGLMRVVAIRLLSFCLEDPTATVEVAELLEDGFRILGFEAASQYPHCGVLWSVISHAGINDYRHKDDETNVTFFDLPMFARMLRFIAFSRIIEAIPQDEIIPEFGSIAQQAGFALGGYQSLSYHESLAIGLTLNRTMEEGAVSKSYFNGLCHSLCRVPVEFIYDGYKMWPLPNFEFLAKRKEIMDAEDDFNKIVQSMLKLLTYYGMFLDGKRLEVAWMPNAPHPSPFLSALQAEQMLFEKAMEKLLEDLREWFGHRTDNAELKDKPVYKIYDKIKLDKDVDKEKDAPKSGRDSDPPKSAKSGSEKKSAVEGVKSSSSNSGPTDKTPVVAAPLPAAAVPTPAAGPAVPAPASA